MDQQQRDQHVYLAHVPCQRCDRAARAATIALALLLQAKTKKTCGMRNPLEETQDGCSRDDSAELRP